MKKRNYGENFFISEKISVIYLLSKVNHKIIFKKTPKTDIFIINDNEKKLEFNKNDMVCSLYNKII